MCADVRVTKSVSYSGSYIYCHNGLLWGQWVVISVSPACCVELVEVVCSGRVDVDVLVEVVLPGRRGGGVEERKRKGEVKSAIRDALLGEMCQILSFIRSYALLQVPRAWLKV